MVKYEVGYAQSRPWPNVRFLRATKCCWGYTAVGVQNPGSTCEEDGQPSLSRSAQRVGRRWLGNGQCLTGQHGSGRRYLRLQASQAPLAPYRCPSASDACSSRREPTERASSDQARRAPSLARRPFPVNARYLQPCNHVADVHDDGNGLEKESHPRRPASPSAVRRVRPTRHGGPLRATDNARFRATTTPLFPRRTAAPCVVASLIHTGPPQGRGKDRLAARLVTLSMGRGGVR